MPFCVLKSNLKIYYRIDGNPEKPWLLLAHGYGSDCTSLDLIVDLLKKDFHILRWDHRGHGQSDKPKGNTYNDTLKLYGIDLLAEDVVELLNSLHITDQKVFLYGHSMGGMIAAQFAVRNRHLLRGLALGSTCPCNDNPTMQKSVLMYKSGELKMDEENFRKTAKQGYNPVFIEAHPEIVELSIKRKMAVGPEILLALLENFVCSYNIEKELRQLNVPTIILHGDQDETIGIAYAHRLAQLIPNAKLVIFSNIGHGINLEVVDQVAEHIIQFFTKL